MPDILSVTLKGEFFSIVEDVNTDYWIFNNKYRSFLLGPYEKLTPAFKAYLEANQFFETLKFKGVLNHE